MKIYGDENNDFILLEMGHRIRDIRLSRSITQKELANDSGVAYSTIVRIENGEGANIENLMRVMRVFGLLHNFDILIPEQEMTPEELYNNKTKRQRAPKVKNNENNWTWGDEKK